MMPVASTEPAPADQATVHSVRHALRLLCAFDTAESELGVSELARRLGLSKSTVHRLLATLRDEGFVEQNPATARYGLGLRLLELGTQAANRLQLHESATAFLEDLHAKTGETAHVAVRDGRDVIYVQRREGPRTLRLFDVVGRRNHAHCTSTGKVLLAALSARQLSAVLDGVELETHTEHTITDLEQLRAELDWVRQRGYALNINETERGVASVAAPIRGADARVVAAISVAGPAERFRGAPARELAAATIEAARGISERLGYPTGDSPLATRRQSHVPNRTDRV